MSATWLSVAVAGLGLVTALLRYSVSGNDDEADQAIKQIRERLELENEALRKAAAVRRRAMSSDEFRKWVQSRGGQRGPGPDAS